MAIMESIDFCYDGKYSKNFGIFNVSMDSGLYSESFLASKSIVETKIRGNPKPYFQGVEYEPLTLTLSFAFEKTWDNDLIREVARWLGGQDHYKPLWFAEDPGRIFYCMCVDESQLIHNGLKQGYITLTMRCDSPYTYSPVFSKLLDFSNIASPTTFDFINGGDVELLPEIWIKKIGNGDIIITNRTNGNEIFKFTGLINNEIVYVDNESEFIETNQVNLYRYDNFNNNYLKLVRGKNVLEINGKCQLSFRYQCRTLQ